MTLAAILIATALFFAGLRYSNLVGLSWSIVEQSAAAVGTLRDAALDDDAREQAARRLSLTMLSMFGRVAVRTIAVIIPPLAVLALCVAAGLTDSTEIWRISTSWPFIAANVAVFAGVALCGQKS